MPYFYDLGYHSMEECPSIALFHETEFSEEQFKDMAAQAYAKAWQNSKWRERNKDKSDDDKFKISCDDLLNRAVEVMVEDFNFQTVKYHQNFNPFGWADVESDQDWDTNYDSDINLIREKVEQIKLVEEREDRLGNLLDKQ